MGASPGRSVFWQTLLSGACIVLAFHPFGLTWLAWLTPVGVTLLVQREVLPGRRPKTSIWLGSFLCWLILFQCVRLPHWAGYIGWPLLSAFLGSYFFLTILVARHFVHRWRIPVFVGLPIAWVGMEYIQSRFCTGISLGMLSHTQASQPLVIQVADLAGCYTVSFFMVGIVSGLVFGFTHWKSTPGQLGLGQTLLLLLVLISYGRNRLQDAEARNEEHEFCVSIIQGSIDTLFPAEGEYEAYLQSISDEYRSLSIEACEQPADLVLWPESMFPVPDVHADPAIRLDGAEQRMVDQLKRQLAFESRLSTGSIRIVEKKDPAGGKITRAWAEVKKSPPMIVGGNSISLGGSQRVYNSAILIDSKGKVESRYGKMRLVLFGEFVPLGEAFPWLYNFFPIPPGLKAGPGPVAMEAGGFLFCPNVCFESTYPHHIRYQLAQLESSGKTVDAIINLSNDGWFWGSNALDMHFANNVFRAVENRKPVLVAANTGFSGQIDSAGRILAKGPRREKQFLRVKMVTSKQQSLYRLVGDWPVFVCFLAVLSCFLCWIFARFPSRKLQ
ncbi:MAG: apolipoprotein N-acyltransferase [Planctomycetota bacterium]|nr:apolipoprotein N-acyltransferase [Planctomycetota bacterium]